MNFSLAVTPSMSLTFIYWTSSLGYISYFLIRSKLSGLSLNVSKYFVQSSFKCFLNLKISNDNNITGLATVMQDNACSVL